MAHMKEQIKTPEKQLSDKEIANLSGAEFKTLVIRELTEHLKSIKKKNKVTLSEIKKNLHGTNSEGKEARIQINDLEQKEEINIQPKRKEETRIERNEKRLRNLWDNFKCTNICIIGMSEGEEKEQEIENLFEKIMKENIPNLAKEIDIQVQEVQRVPNKMDAKRTTPRHIILKMPKIKDRERILKAAREKQRVTYKGGPIRLPPDFSKETL